MRSTKTKLPRGASRKSTPVRKPWKIGRWLKLASILLLAGASAYYGWLGIQTSLNAPVTRVVVSGELQYLNRERLVEIVQPRLNRGFWQLDLDEVRQAMETLAWVDSARVTREWPDQLVVEVMEQSPIARWQDDALLNHRGEKFRPESTAMFEGLPQLSGPQGSETEVMHRYREFSELLSSQGLRVKQVVLDARRSWTVEIDSGVQVVLGRDEILQRVQRFLIAYRVGFGRDFSEIAKLDLRYPNGLAVAWLPESNS